MASGLPVLASPEGGMAEMIEDGQSGWIAGGATPEALRAALDRALEESPERLAAMGSAAAAAIRQLCDPDRVVRMHLEFRQEVCERGARQAAGRTRPPAPGQGVACIVIDGTDEAAVERTVRSLGAQSVSPAAVVIVRMKEPGTDAAPGMPFDARLRATWRYHDVMEGHKGVARNAAAAFAIELVREAVGVPPLGLAFVEPGVELDPCFLDVAVRALHAEAHAGLVAGWTLTRTGTLSAPPQPSFPHQFLGNDVGPGAVIRVQAFSDVAGFDGAVPEGVESWDLANRIMANGWRAVTIPAPAAVDRANRPVPDLNGLSPQHALLERLPDVVSRHAHELAVLAAAAIARSSTDAPPWAPPTLRDVIGFVVRHPLQTARRLNERTRMLMRMRAAERRARSSRGSAR
jgi:hypothetical protein